MAVMISCICISLPPLASYIYYKYAEQEQYLPNIYPHPRLKQQHMAAGHAPSLKWQLLQTHKFRNVIGLKSKPASIMHDARPSVRA